MHACNGCQERLLDSLYGLLDSAEEQELRAHLDGCAACRVAHEKARAGQQCLAAAARLAFPEVSFAPPEPGPVLLPLRPRMPRRAAAWRPWAVAAAALLAVAGLGVPAYRASADYAAARAVAKEHELTVAQGRAEIKKAEEQLAQVKDTRDKSVQEVRREVEAREMRLEVVGPRNVLPGAPTEYRVNAYGLDGQPADADLSVAIDGLRDRKNLAAKAPEAAKADRKPGDGKSDKAKEEQASGPRIEKLAKGVYKVQLPPTLPLDAGRTLVMDVSARRAGADPQRQALSVRGAVQLSAPSFLSHLTTDKPMYQPGEIVRFRSLTLDRATLAPPAEAFQLRFVLAPPVGPERVVAWGTSSLQRFDARDRKTTQANGPDGKPATGIGAGELQLDSESRGGEYVLTVSDDMGRFPPVTRRFVVNEYQKPRLDKKLEFNRPSYGPGDEVQVSATARRLDGGPLRACPVEATANIDGAQAAIVKGVTDDDGRAVLTFKLPAIMERGLGSLSVLFNAPGTPETTGKPIPIVLDKVDVEFFPEGGDLVAGQPTRVYFQARTPAGKPARVAGLLLENGQHTAIRAETLADGKEAGVNQGLGSFRFTPKPGRRYALRIDSPRGIAEPKKLPDVQADGVALSVEGGVFQPGDPIRVKVATAKPRQLLVGAYCRDTLLDSVRLQPGQTEAVLRPVSPVGGVCRITVFEVLETGAEQRALRPRAERLVYRHPGKRVDVSISPGKRHYAPGEKATLRILATDENEKPVAAMAQVAVIDQGVTSLADERTARTGPTYFLLTNEVRRAEDLEHADFLLGQHPKAAVVLDHLLGTQGWRRFAEQDPAGFRRNLQRDARHLREAERQQRAGEAERLLVMIGQSQPKTTDFDQDRIDEAQAKFDEEAQDVVARHAEAAEKVESAAAAPAYLAALARLKSYDGVLRHARLVVLPILMLLSAIGLLVALSQAERKRAGWALASGALGVGCACLLLWVARIPAGLSLPAPMPKGEVAALEVPADADAAVNEREILPPPNRKMTKDDVAGKGDEGGIGRPAAAFSRLSAAPPMAPMPGGMPGMGYAGGPQTTGGGRGGFGGKGRAMAGIDRQAEARDAVFRHRIAPAEQLKRLAARADGSQEMGARFFAPLAERPGRGLLGKDMEKKSRERQEAYHMAQPLVFREYAHTRPEGLSATVRADFAETVYWHPVLVLPEGKGEVAFQLPDSVTRFAASVFAHTLDGRLGAATKLIDSRLPVAASPRLPLEVTATDRILAPVAVSSTVADKLAGTLTVTGHEGFDLEGDEARTFDLPPEGSRRVLVGLKPSVRDGTASLSVEASGNGFASDATRQSVRVVPDGFPVERSSSDLLEKSATHKVDVPADMIPGTLRLRVDVYPSLLADLTKGLDGLLREPYGCFEQTSTTNYPNVLILDFLKANKKASPEVEARARQLLQKGYARLTSFECQDGATKAKRGYEWFGGTVPPHDALTAYGLLQFTDMARLQDVDPAMLARTRAYLLSLRDGKGGFNRSTAKYAFGGAPAHLADAYMVWALASTGSDDLSAEQAVLLEKARTTEDAYFLSLVSLGLSHRGKGRDAEALLGRVAKLQKEDGRLDAATSITRSGGRDLQIETTALAVMGWLKANQGAFGKNVHLAVKWLGAQRQGSGSFGSTQSTILALKALLAHAQATPRTTADCELVVFLGDREVARRKIPADAQGAISIDVPAPEEAIKPGTPARLRAELAGAASYPHTVSWSCRAVKPANEPAPLVALTTKLEKSDLKEGDPARLVVRIENRSGAIQGMATAIVGLPAGLALPENLEQLRTLCKLPPDGKAPLLSAFEVQGRELVLYWRGLEKEQAIEVPVDLVARVPGTYRGPASRAYLYYNARNKHWVDPLAVRIAPVE